MPHEDKHSFYKRLEALNDLIKRCFKFSSLEDGIISLDGDLLVSLDEQQEMLSRAFFETMDLNPATQAWYDILKDFGIIQADKWIPLLRDLPLRTTSLRSLQPGELKRVVDFTHDILIPQHWGHIFPETIQAYAQAIQTLVSQGRIKKDAIDAKLITKDPEEGKPLQSGGYTLYLHQVLGKFIWIHLADEDLPPEQYQSACVEITLNEGVNFQEVFKPEVLSRLKTEPLLALNVRGVSKTITKPSDCSNSGGHQHLFLLDRAAKTIYAIDDTAPSDASAEAALRENKLAFVAQIHELLKKVGDNTQYTLSYFTGRSRQPSRLIEQPCNISQFLSLLAIENGVKPSEIQTQVPDELFTLLYLLQRTSLGANVELNSYLLGLATQVKNLMGTYVKRCCASLRTFIDQQFSVLKGNIPGEITISAHQTAVTSLYEEIQRVLNELNAALESQTQISLLSIQKCLKDAIQIAQQAFKKEPAWMMWLRNFWHKVCRFFSSLFSSKPHAFGPVPGDALKAINLFSEEVTQWFERDQAFFKTHALNPREAPVDAGFRRQFGVD